MPETPDPRTIQMYLVVGVFVFIPFLILTTKIILNLWSIRNGVKFDGPVSSGPMNSILGTPRYQSVNERSVKDPEGMMTRKADNGLVEQNQILGE